MTAERPLTVLLVGNYGPSIAAARSLARAGHRVIAGDAGDHSPVLRSRSCHATWPHPPIEDPDAFLAALARVIEREVVDVVLPFRPTFVEMLTEHRARLPEHVALAAPERVVAEIAIDKSRMYALARELGVPHRSIGIAHDLTELVRVAEEVGYPCVVRPGTETTQRLPGRRKAIIASDQEILTQELPSWPNGHDALLIQGYVPGRRRNIHFAARDGRMLARVQTEAIRTDRRDGTGLGVEGRSVTPDPRLDDHCEALTRELGYSGVGLYQFIMPPGGEPSFLELNPRIGTALAFIDACGLDIALAACTIASGRGGWQPPSDDRYPIGKRYAWTTKDIFGWKVARTHGELGRADSLRWLATAARTAVTADAHLTWSLRDPMPTVAILRELMRAPR